MARLTPKDIRNKQFDKKLFGGYNPDEVDSFLVKVASEMEALLRKIEILEKQTPERRKAEVIEMAKKEIERMIEAAKEEKERLEEEKSIIEAEIEQLKLTKRKIENKLKMSIIEMTQILEELKADETEGEGKGVSEISEGGDFSSERHTESSG